jgi:hypothetical protein
MEFGKRLEMRRKVIYQEFLGFIWDYNLEFEMSNIWIFSFYLLMLIMLRADNFFS